MLDSHPDHMGAVYFAHCGKQGLIKIGRSADVHRRKAAHLTSNPEFQIVGTLETEHDKQCESFLHSFFYSKRKPGTTEFFLITEKDLEQGIKAA